MVLKIPLSLISVCLVLHVVLIRASRHTPLSMKLGPSRPNKLLWVRNIHRRVHATDRYGREYYSSCGEEIVNLSYPSKLAIAGR